MKWVLGDRWLTPEQRAAKPLPMWAPDLHDTLIRKAGFWLDYGPKFGHEGEGFMRINLACARSVVDDAIARLQQTFAR